MTTTRGILILPLLCAACAPMGAGPPAAAFLDPGVRAAQEAACRDAAAEALGVAPAAVTARRSSSDQANLSIVWVLSGTTTGACRVSTEPRVLDVAF